MGWALGALGGRCRSGSGTSPMRSSGSPSPSTLTSHSLPAYHLCCRLGDKIGSGRFSTVHAGNWHGDVAIKFLDMEVTIPSQFQSHPNSNPIPIPIPIPPMRWKCLNCLISAEPWWREHPRGFSSGCCHFQENPPRKPGKVTIAINILSTITTCRCCSWEPVWNPPIWRLSLPCARWYSQYVGLTGYRKVVLIVL